MADHDDATLRNDAAEPTTREARARAARRKFLRQALAAGSAVALAEILPPSWLTAAMQSTSPCTTGPTFTPVTPITSQNHKLRAVIKVVSGTRTIPATATTSTQAMLRYYSGYNPDDTSQKWPASAAAAGPGPTLRAEIGDVVQITFLNQVKVADFPGTLDAGEQGRHNGCDEATSVDPKTGQPLPGSYPAKDVFPDCLHGSSSANIHFHGTHVTPSTTGDNVLVNVRPDPRVTEKDVQRAFDKIFEHGDMGHSPQHWDDLPLGWREYQQRLVREYDRTAPYVGPGANPDGHGLPPNLRLEPQNELAIKEGLWPQWYVGSYPYSFKIPKYEEKDGQPTGVKMGQAPGTHWYHSHKHGSTAINMFNGLSGAFIITDNSPTGYDGKLQSFYKSQLKEVVMVFQQIISTPNLLSAKPAGPAPILINGQLAPTLTMQAGEVQLWRMINATVQAFLNINLGATSGQAPACRLTARDGVQLRWENYNNPQINTPPFNMAPANRIDLLVQAPTTPGCYQLLNGTATLANINVIGPGINPAMPFPTTEADYPRMPPFLKDIEASDVRLRREIFYGWKDPEIFEKNGPGRKPYPPLYTINGKQFEDQVIDEVMLLDSVEEWTIYNLTTGKNGGKGGIQHPFHIHVNPFQIVEVFDPATMNEPAVIDKHFIWWDTFGIPASSNVKADGSPWTDKSGKQIVKRGYFKMRTRFVDFTGQYVEHCHILPHEDRGMMQLLEIVSNRTVLKHH